MGREHGWHVDSGVRPRVAHAGQVGHAGGSAGHKAPFRTRGRLVEAVGAVGQVKDAGVGGGGATAVTGGGGGGGGGSGWLGN